MDGVAKTGIVAAEDSLGKALAQLGCSFGVGCGEEHGAETAIGCGDEYAAESRCGNGVADGFTRAAGRLTGYRWGLERKRQLLEMEKR